MIGRRQVMKLFKRREFDRNGYRRRSENHWQSKHQRPLVQLDCNTLVCSALSVRMEPLVQLRRNRHQTHADPQREHQAGNCKPSGSPPCSRLAVHRSRNETTLFQLCKHHFVLQLRMGELDPVQMNTRMHRTMFRYCALIIVIFACGCTALPKHDLNAEYRQEKTQIERVLHQILDAAEKKDLPRLDSYHFYGPKFTKFGGGQLGRLDAAAARKGEHDGLGAANNLSMRADDLKIDVFGDVGIATFILSYSYGSASERIEKKERSTLVFVKDDGSWKITHEHFSPFKAP